MHMLTTYWLIISMITLILLMIPSMLSMWMKKWSNKALSCECGMSVNSTPRKHFSIRLFLLMVLFIIFDLEIALIPGAPMLTPWLKQMTLFFSLFMAILVSGIIYEWMEGPLTWKL